MRINTNVVALQGWRAFQSADQQVTKNQARLSSGLRLNSAKDDAAGLRISQNLMGQVKGLVQASRNATNGISLLNTAEAALSEVSELLQRGRELAVQASNGTLTTGDKQILQVELNQLLSEMDRIFESTSFNGLSLFNPSGIGAAMVSTIEGLRGGWLQKAEEVIQTFYGLFGDNVPLTITLERSGPQSTWVTGTPVFPGGKLDSLELHINLSDFGTGGGPDGGTGPVYNDRKIARALTQIMLARNSDYYSLPQWFVSGVADFIAGGDEMLKEAQDTFGAAALVNAIATPWADDTLHKASAYLAVKYMNSLLSAPVTMANVMQELVLTNDLDSALMATVGPDVASFVNDFQLFGAGYLSGMNLTDSDVGGVGGGDASGVIPNGAYSSNPLSGFSVVWPNMTAGVTNVILQVGANEGQTITLSIPELSRWTIGLLNIDLVTRSTEAMPLFDQAINAVTSVRSYLGSVHNRLERAVAVNDAGGEYQLSSYSRITDLDFASEMTGLVKNQILLSTSSAILAQANTVRQNIMWLFRDLKAFSPQAGLLQLN